MLLHLSLQPEQIGTVDLGGLLMFPEHRALWAVLQRTYWAGPYAADAAENAALFGLAFDAELRRAYPKQWRNYLDVLTSASEAAAHRAHEDATERPQHEPGHLRLSAYQHGVEWWLKRLQRIAEARRLIHSAQAIAERAWREDVDGARHVAGGIARGGLAIRVEI